MGIMGHFTDEEAYPIVGRLLAGLPSGSYFALYDGADTNEAFNQAQQGYNDSGAVPYHLRSPEQFARFFEGLELVEPGVVPVPHWRPDPDATRRDLLLLRSRTKAVIRSAQRIPACSPAATASRRVDTPSLR